MKKNKLFLFSLSILLICSCDFANDDSTSNINPGINTPETYILSVNDFSSCDTFTDLSSKLKNTICSDYNNDGYCDIAGIDDAKLVILLNNRNGNFQTPLEYTLPIESGDVMDSIQAADFNSDSLVDIAVSNYDNNDPSVQSRIYFYYQKIDGTFSNELCIQTDNSYYITSGDINNDGLIDIVAVGSSLDDEIEIYYQNNSHSFDSPIVIEISNTYNSTAQIKDINNDGKNDILIMSEEDYENKNLCVLFQDGSGCFSNSDIVYLDTGLNENSNSYVVIDLNNDSLDDVVLTTGSSGGHLVVFYQQGNKEFLKSDVIETYASPERMAVVDLNNDFKKDIIVLHPGWGKLTVFTQKSNGFNSNYAEIDIPYSTSYGRQTIITEDFNNDGKIDIFITDIYNGLSRIENIGNY